MSISLADSVTIWSVEKVTNWRNNDKQSNILMTGVKRVVAELTYATIPAIALVESVTRGIIAVIAKGIIYLLPQKFRKYAQENIYTYLAAGSIGSATFGMISLACVIQNIYKSKIDLPQLVNQAVPCFSPGS